MPYSTITVAGSRLSPEQACRAAQRFIDQNVTLRNHASQVTAGQVKAYRSQPDGQAMVYAVNLGNDRGFVLVGGQADEIIGYCDHGEFAAELMPANMRSWLDSYMAAAQLTVLKSWLFTDPDNTGDYTTRSDESSSPFFEGNGYLVYPAMNSHNHNGFDAEFELGCRIVKNDGSVTRDFAWSTHKFAVDVA